MARRSSGPARRRGSGGLGRAQKAVSRSKSAAQNMARPRAMASSPSSPSRWRPGPARPSQEPVGEQHGGPVRQRTSLLRPGCADSRPPPPAGPDPQTRSSVPVDEYSPGPACPHPARLGPKTRWVRVTRGHRLPVRGDQASAQAAQSERRRGLGLAGPGTARLHPGSTPLPPAAPAPCSRFSMTAGTTLGRDSLSHDVKSPPSGCWRGPGGSARPCRRGWVRISGVEAGPAPAGSSPPSRPGAALAGPLARLIQRACAGGAADRPANTSGGAWPLISNPGSPRRPRASPALSSARPVSTTTGAPAAATHPGDRLQPLRVGQVQVEQDATGRGPGQHRPCLGEAAHPRHQASMSLSARVPPPA